MKKSGEGLSCDRETHWRLRTAVIEIVARKLTKLIEPSVPSVKSVVKKKARFNHARTHSQRAQRVHHWCGHEGAKLAAAWAG